MNLSTAIELLAGATLIAALALIDASRSNKPANLRTALAGLALLVSAYLAYAYWSVERLQTAIHDRDAGALEAMIDWPRAREGIRIAAQAIMVRRAASDQEAMINSTLAARSVDAWVTPGGLRDYLGRLQNVRLLKIESVRVITATLLRGQLLNANSSPLLNFEMEFGGGVWRVARVEFTPELLEAGVNGGG